MAFSIHSQTLEQQLLEWLEGHGVVQADLAMWRQTIPHMSAQDLQVILDLLKEDSSQVSFLTKNLVAKTQALVSGDHVAWQKLIADEKEYIDQV